MGIEGTRPIASPGLLPREFLRPDLADDADLDLAGILELLLDLLGDVPGHDLRREIVDLLGLHHHPNLAAGLHRVGLRDARVGLADLLEAFQPLHVCLETLPPSTRPAPRAAVG